MLATTLGTLEPTPTQGHRTHTQTGPTGGCWMERWHPGRPQGHQGPRKEQHDVGARA